MNWKDLRGFNYQPSYGTSGLELWMKFDAQIIDLELGRGKKYFPWMNAIRLWLSWDAYKRDGRRFASNFEMALAIASRHGLKVMPVLFNRWHTNSIDYGGIYIDHFLPGSRNYVSGLFESYMEAIVGGHANDARIFAWDLCNEPLFYGSLEIPLIVVESEMKWLVSLYEDCKRFKAQAPVTVFPMRHFDELAQISDVFSFHPYYMGGDKGDFERSLDSFVEKAAKAKKPLIATETCWGSYDDAERAELIRYTLGELNKRKIGWLAYLLHASGVADAHAQDEGALSNAGNLAFIMGNGDLRPGHQVPDIG